MSKHTPGPWRLMLNGILGPVPEGLTPEQAKQWELSQAVLTTPFRDNLGGYVLTSDAGRVGATAMRAPVKGGRAWKTPDPEGLANAHLMTAGPELLEAAEQALDRIRRLNSDNDSMDPDDDPAVQALLAAIRKARGRA